MIIKCENCGAKLKIADEKLIGKNIKIKCPKCTSIMPIKKKAAVEEALKKDVASQKLTEETKEKDSVQSQEEEETTKRRQEEIVKQDSKKEKPAEKKEETKEEIPDKVQKKIDQIHELSYSKNGKKAGDYEDIPETVSTHVDSIAKRAGKEKKKGVFSKLLWGIIVLLVISACILIFVKRTEVAGVASNIHKATRKALNKVGIIKDRTINLVIKSERAYFLKTNNEKNIFLIYGKIENIKKESLKDFRLRGKLFDDKKKLIKTIAVPLGVFFNEDTVKGFKDEEEIKNAYFNPAYNFLELSVKFTSIPFMLIFYDIADVNIKYVYDLKLIEAEENIDKNKKETKAK